MAGEGVGILYHPKVAPARPLAERLAGTIVGPTWVASAWDDEDFRDRLGATRVLICLGGDGTVLRTARAAAPFGVPIITVNLGSLGFITELRPETAVVDAQRLLAGDGWIDERSMLDVSFPSERGDDRTAGEREQGRLVVLNDAVVSRGAIARVIGVESDIDGALLTTYYGDGVIVATATGSTGYSLAAGGPILHPRSQDLILNPLTPHLSLTNCLVLPPSAQVTMRVSSDHQAMLSLDGQVHVTLESGDVVRVSRSQHVARLLRLDTPSHFYGTLTERLQSRQRRERIE